MSKSTIDRAALTEEILDRFPPYVREPLFSQMWAELRRTFEGLEEDDLLTAAENLGIDISEYCVFFATDETSTEVR